MTACADNEDAWRLLGVVWSAAGSSLVCDNFTELAGETTAPSYRDAPLLLVKVLGVVVLLLRVLFSHLFLYFSEVLVSCL